MCRRGDDDPAPVPRLTQLYPTHESYVLRLLAATNDAVASRFLLCDDAATIMRKASASTIGGTDTFTAVPPCATRSNHAQSNDG